MHISLPTILSLTYHLSLASPLHLSLPRTLPSPQPIIPSLRSRHSVYIDQKIQIYQNATPNIPLNHNLYHQRNVDINPPTTSNISLNHELYSKRNTIASSPVPTNSGTETLHNTTNVNTEKSCISALTAPHGSAINPSGIAACYNILAFDNATGVFGVEIRLYRITKPSGAWVEVDKMDERVDVGVVFKGARTLKIGSVGKRDVGGSAVEALVPVVGREEAKDLWRRNAVVPVYVGGIEIEGMVDGNRSLVDVDVVTIRTLLTPTITLSSTSTNANNTLLTLTLSTNTTSFLTGLFALPSPTPTTGSKSSEASLLAAAGFEKEYVLPGTSMVGFPTSLVVTCTWTVLCLFVQGLGFWRKWRAREEYRWRVRRRLGCLGGEGGIASGVGDRA